MKKYLLFIVFLLILSGCGNSSAVNTSADSPEATSPTQTPAQTSASSFIQTTASPVSEIITLQSTEDTTNSVVDTQPSQNAVVLTAESLIGIPFASGGSSPSEGFDNSGFIYYVLRENGYINCPRQINEQVEWGENVSGDEIKPGDIVYFSAEPGELSSFGGVYVGGSEMIYSPSPGEAVKKTDISTPYWQERFTVALSL